MSQPEKWWWGLLPLVLLWILVNLFMDGTVESDLATRSKAALGTFVQNPAVSVSGRDATLAGSVFSPADAQTAVDHVGGTWGVRRVISELAASPVVKPYDWHISQDGKRVTLSGHVPDTTVQMNLLAAVRAAFPQSQINDQTIYAAGAPEGFEKGALFVISQLAPLAGGNASLTDSGFSIAGKAPTDAVYDAALKAIHAPPKGLTLVKADIVAPLQYTFSATRLDGKLTLTGDVPSEDVHKQILAEAKRLFFNEEIVDRLTVLGNAPQNFGSVILAGINALSRLADGVFTVTNTDVKLSGGALYERAVAAIRTNLADQLPAGYQTDTSAITVHPEDKAVDSKSCQAELDGLLGKATILFETNGATISKSSEGLLDRIVTTIGHCPEATIEISGHTDSTGNEPFNLALSERRAKAVFDYLVAAGIPADKLSATGYGSSRPVASNDTEEGRAKNRRIEFTVK
ncbi:OmpA family protein [Beijerinckia indica]|uniref:OmpA/MotB domain protein n=1 Tax=Beijerinckia indica subsp. indica (strain ATCC 9039 / DSM 1715 / NCIMB 8712) TaxID=395963 RepID=B2IJ75_BEII9|nr:OmpA family protein [Beijerinckia indica]ACB94838.1 OmpA/MotB domain protein [Beijerinckia indica subsp. indica ATCC 9039]